MSEEKQDHLKAAIQAQVKTLQELSEWFHEAIEIGWSKLKTLVEQEEQESKGFVALSELEEDGKKLSERLKEEAE